MLRLTNKSKLYFGLALSFALLIFSLLLSFKNLSHNTQLLKQLEVDQIQLFKYEHTLHYDIKKNQATILQLLLGKKFSLKNSAKIFQEINKSITQLEEFAKKHQTISKQFLERLKIIKKRVIAYKLVQDSLVQAQKSSYKEDLDDALIGYNQVTLQFSSDIKLLQEYTNSHITNEVLKLQKNNNESANTIIFSFLISILLIIFSVLKFVSISRKVELQLEKTRLAEAELKSAQKQLLEYNNDLESEIARKTAEIYQKVYTHFLSNLPNRNKLLEDINKEKISMIAILNIDKFQAFNDVYGEEVGNIAIKMSADFLADALKNEALSLYHIGGDEFVIICNKIKEEPTLFIQAIDTILKEYRAHKFQYEDKKFQFLMSAGISYGAKEKLLAYADMALKDAKKRNIELSIFNDDKKIEKVHENDIQCHKRLLHAMETDSVLSYFQPIVPIQDNSLPRKYESLVRIEYDEKIIPPFRFIDVAKANRIYYKITRTVIQNTLEVVKKYQIPASLNISMRDITNEKTMQYFFQILQDYEYNELLTVELLETEDFADYDVVNEFCTKVHSFGVKIALDDFGSGYANFSHILHLPIDYIKIDATLISNINRDNNSRIMVETIVDLAKKLNLYTIAEFVASKEILDVVREIGVDYAQGYYLGKPEPIEHHLESFKAKV